MAGVLHYELVGEYERGGMPESPTEKIADILFFYGLPTLVLLSVGGIWLIYRALRPIASLTAAAERVHAGNLTERILPSGRDDEIGRLTIVFNEMLARDLPLPTPRTPPRIANCFKANWTKSTGSPR
jgi:methyl-accepting chemotaxis protein